MNIGMLREQRPIEPASFVILAIGIVVPALGASRFVTHQHHRHAYREHCNGQKVLHLPISEFLYREIFSGAFDATVPASVVVGAITVFLVVCFVVLGVVRHEVVKREAVMTRDKINTLLSLAFFVTVNCRATNQAVGKPSHRSVFATKKASHVISEPSVPFLPTVPDETSYLVKPSC